ncbi:D-alanyl-D-alanine carboxypeptidase family protein [Mesorhizobium sp. RMAD-H1]|uniref:D-alanyl-D-alanine carboxypeptidase family protein n=1 Tax=Mesorhizobium sp. RMAD-H1 TaxID=2587065 RepID=UPI0017EA6E5E|nr:D-alanyl-D-alanine carboxypeptidase family protein [Mesorhizobium sp. RMAD-H1]MBB2973851.1 D-alanyl-D-alanine carboxypeptidase (penicillin-binding protein 5/6) [Mesorhizobium sp. RMAD-H1]
MPSIRYTASVLCGLMGVIAASVCLAQPVETRARQALLIDDATGTVLFAKNADELIPPASLAKLMTMEVVFDALTKGELSLDRTFPVSEYAWRTGGAPSGTSTMFAKIKSTPRVEDLVQGVIVQSANDGCIVLAEGMAGSEEQFARRMNERARALGLEKSTFVNSTGLPAPGQKVSITELVSLARHIHRTYPQFYRYYAQESFTWNNIFQRNRNPLLRLDIGADGLGTGYTQESGFALVASAERNGRRLFLGLSGLASDKERAEEARKLIEWGMDNFEDVLLFPENDVVGEASVYGGEHSAAKLRTGEAVELLLPKRDRPPLKARIVYNGPLIAPVEAGKQVGTLKIWMGEDLVQEKPVFTAEAVNEGGIGKKAFDAALELSTGWIRQYR